MSGRWSVILSMLGILLAGCATSHTPPQLQPAAPALAPPLPSLPPVDIIRYSPRMQFGPRIHMRLVIRIPRDPSNREFCVEIPAVRRTCQSLDMYSPEIFEWVWKDLSHPGGEDEVWVVLAQGHPNYRQYQVRKPFTVMMAED